MNPDLPGSLEEQVVELRSRVRRLEETLYRHGIPLQEVQVQPPAGPATASQGMRLAMASISQTERESPPPPASAEAPPSPSLFGLLISLTFFRISSCRTTSPTSIVFPRPTSSAMPVPDRLH